MIRRFALSALALHALYVAAWLVLPGWAELRFERYAVTAAVTIAEVAYVVLAVAYVWASKSRLNTALAINKTFWALVIGALVLPALWGVLLRHAPYRSVANPYTYWTAPAWLRTYAWIGLSISIIGVLYEFFRVNWGKGSNPPPVPAEPRSDQLIACQIAATPVPERADA